MRPGQEGLGGTWGPRSPQGRGVQGHWLEGGKARGRQAGRLGREEGGWKTGGRWGLPAAEAVPGPS